MPCERELGLRWMGAGFMRLIIRAFGRALASSGILGDATDWQVTYSGLSGQPDLSYHLRAYSMSLSAISRYRFGTPQGRPFTLRDPFRRPTEDRLSIWEDRSSTMSSLRQLQ